MLAKTSIEHNFSFEIPFQIIASKENEYKLNDQPVSMPKIQNGIGIDLGKEASSERVKNVFMNIEKACLEGKVDELWTI